LLYDRSYSLALKLLDRLSNLSSPAIVILNQNSLQLARRIAEILPKARIYGLEHRTVDVDVVYEDFGDTVRELFSSGSAIVGICASGILIRTLAPLIKDKWHEPPVLAVAEDGSAVVPLLGGLHGVNDLARTIAGVLAVAAAVTATGDIRFRMTLLCPPQGYHLANPEDAKTFIADLLAGATLQLQGEALWLQQSQLPFATDGKLTIAVTEYIIPTSPDRLVYHPATLVLALANLDNIHREESIDFLQQKLKEANLSRKSIAAILVLDRELNHPSVKELTRFWDIPLRYLQESPENRINTAKELISNIKELAEGDILISENNFAIVRSPFPLNIDNIGCKRGKLAVIGTGPGAIDWISPEARQALQTASDWVGYKTYLDLVEPLRQGQTRYESDNRVEIERAKTALNLAAAGRSIALVSSGDAGIFAMAAAVFEALETENRSEWQYLEIKICPGISAMQGAAALVGAPLGHDFCVISLSDILKPWEIIQQRLEAAAAADFAIAIYNPTSKDRAWQLDTARDILLRHRSSQTPVVLARNVGREKQQVEVITLDRLTAAMVDMRTVVLIGSTKTRLIPRQDDRPWVYTPRSYGE
jgi:cobalt-precorrin 5A hydrolase / precorrin-3B C17-methyltransferase